MKDFISAVLHRLKDVWDQAQLTEDLPNYMQDDNN